MCATYSNAEWSVKRGSPGSVYPQFPLIRSGKLSRIGTACGIKRPNANSPESTLSDRAFSMTIAELHANEELRRHEFPIVAEKVFLAHAANCPLPRRVVDAITDYSLLAALSEQEAAFPATRFHHCRLLAAKLLNAQMDEIAFVGPTSLGLSLVANGLSVRKGDNILIYHDDYPSNVYPWMALAKRGRGPTDEHPRTGPHPEHRRHWPGG